MEHAVVPLPSSLRPSTGAPFPLTASTPITGDPSTAAELQRIIDVAASTRPEDAMPDPPAIDLRIAQRRLPHLQFMNGEAYHGVLALPNFVRALLP